MTKVLLSLERRTFLYTALEIKIVWVRTNTFMLVEWIDSFHLIIGQLKVMYIEVFCDSM